MKIGEVLVIGEYLYWEGGSSEVVLPSFQGIDDCEEFSVVDVVISLSGEERVR